jgi:hypothetical protein
MLLHYYSYKQSLYAVATISLILEPSRIAMYEHVAFKRSDCWLLSIHNTYSNK